MVQQNKRKQRDISPSPDDLSEVDPREHDPYGIMQPSCTFKDHQKYRKGKVLAARIINCEENPNCLYGLGEYEKGIWKEEEFIKERLGDDPKSLQRQSYKSSVPKNYHTVTGTISGTYLLPCGLRNLGATCYLNSMLQCLFMNISFRQAVYNWLPLDCKSDNYSLSTYSEKEYQQQNRIMKALQHLFASMQLGNQAAYSTIEFAEALSLDNIIQQDAQEFSKLLLAHLRTVFQKSQAHQQCNVVDEIFEGKIIYITKCLNCQVESKRLSSYYDISLNIKGHKSVERCLQSYLSSELLDGENKYFCAVCQSKQCAKRYITLDHNTLPPILTIQLMRFIYDAAAGRKKKATDLIEMNATINMSEILRKYGHASESTCSSSDVTYQLYAYLNHRGKSTHSGHYTASISYPTSSRPHTEWFEFDDALVTPIGITNKTILQSRDAYMLLYIRDDIHENNQFALGLNKSSNNCRTISPPLDIANLVIEENLTYEKAVTIYQAKADEIINSIKKRKESYSHYLEYQTPIPPVTSEELYYWINVRWLKAWIIGENINVANNDWINSAVNNVGNFNPAQSKDKENMNLSSTDIVSCNQTPKKTAYFCPHSCAKKSKLCFAPWQQRNFKRISSKLYSHLHESTSSQNHFGKVLRQISESDPPFTNDNYAIALDSSQFRCYDCQAQYISDIRHENKLISIAEYELCLLREKVDAKHKRTSSQKYAIMSRAWIDQYKKSLKATIKGVPESEKKKVCRSQSAQLQVHFNDDLPSNDVNELLLNHDIICPHNKLTLDKSSYKTVPNRVWDYFAEKYPSSVAFTSDQSRTPCQRCLIESEDSESSDEVYDNKILKISPVLQLLYHKQCHSSSIQKINVQDKSPGDMFYFREMLFEEYTGSSTIEKLQNNCGVARLYFLPSTWLQKWMNYIQNPQRHDCPKLMDSCAEMNCKHRKFVPPKGLQLLLRDGLPVEKSTFPISFVSLEELNEIIIHYDKQNKSENACTESLSWCYTEIHPSENGKLLITWKDCSNFQLQNLGLDIINIDQNINDSLPSQYELKSSPLLCVDCTHACLVECESETTNFSCQLLNIQLLRDDQPVYKRETLSLCQQRMSNVGASGNDKNGDITFEKERGYRRRSQRLLDSKRQGGWAFVRCSANDTVYMTKYEISNDLKAPALCQKLYYKGMLLENNRTLASYGIKPGDLLYLRIMSQVPDESQYFEEEQERETEVGFKNSVFHTTAHEILKVDGFAEQTPISSDICQNIMHTEKLNYSAGGWRCGICTLINDDATNCCAACLANRVFNISDEEMQ